MRAMVTGGAGFVGSALVDRLLAEGYAVDVVDDLSTGSLANLAEARADRRNELTIHTLDVTDPALVDVAVRRRAEVIFHLAGTPTRAASVLDPVATVTAHLAAGLRVLEAARAASVQKVIVVVGAADLYGEPDGVELPLRESVPRRPDSPLGVAAAALLDHLAVARELHQVEHAALVLPTVYGPRQRPGTRGSVVATLVDELVAGRPGTVTGDGTQARDLLHVDDAVDALVRAAQRGSGLVCHLGWGDATTVGALHRHLAAVAGVPAGPDHAPARAHERHHVALDSGRARIHLGWQPWTSLQEGLAGTVRWAHDEAARAR